MTVITEHRVCIDPLAEVGEQVGSQSEECDPENKYEQHAKAEPVEGGFSSENENEIDESLDEKG